MHPVYPLHTYKKPIWNDIAPCAVRSRTIKLADSNHASHFKESDSSLLALRDLLMVYNLSSLYTFTYHLQSQEDFKTNWLMFSVLSLQLIAHSGARSFTDNSQLAGTPKQIWTADFTVKGWWLSRLSMGAYKLPHEQHISLFINFVLILSQMGWYVIFQSCGAWKFTWELTNQNCPIVTIPYALMFWCLVLWTNLPALFPSMGGKSSYSLLRSLLTFWMLQHPHRNL